MFNRQIILSHSLVLFFIDKFKVLSVFLAFSVLSKRYSSIYNKVDVYFFLIPRKVPWTY